MSIFRRRKADAETTVDSGTDVADGGPGRDRCDAERERRCER